LSSTKRRTSTQCEAGGKERIMKLKKALKVPRGQMGLELDRNSLRRVADAFFSPKDREGLLKFLEDCSKRMEFDGDDVCEWLRTGACEGINPLRVAAITEALASTVEQVRYPTNRTQEQQLRLMESHYGWPTELPVTAVAVKEQLKKFSIPQAWYLPVKRSKLIPEFLAQDYSSLKWRPEEIENVDCLALAIWQGIESASRRRAIQAVNYNTEAIGLAFLKWLGNAWSNSLSNAVWSRVEQSIAAEGGRSKFRSADWEELLVRWNGYTEWAAEEVGRRGWHITPERNELIQKYIAGVVRSVFFPDRECCGFARDITPRIPEDLMQRHYSSLCPVGKRAIYQLLSSDRFEDPRFPYGGRNTPAFVVIFPDDPTPAEPTIKEVHTFLGNPYIVRNFFSPGFLEDCP